jgi:hypothetical protein
MTSEIGFVGIPVGLIVAATLVRWSRKKSACPQAFH